ncbi:ClpP-like prohead protease/major capsid protein fusion protein, partial [Vibrio parahaemolyticus]
NRQKELLNMPEQVKGLMSPKAQVPNPSPTPNGNERVAAIQNVFAYAPGRFPDVLAACIADQSCTPDMAKDKLLAAMGKDTTPSSPPNSSLSAFASNGNIVGDSMKQALLGRLGLDSVEKDNPYKVSDLFDMAKASLVDRGVSISMIGSRQQVVGMAFTHSNSDFGNILIDVSEKSLLKGWEESPETFEAWTQKGQLNNFKEAHRAGLHGFPSLNKVPEGAEYKYVTTDDYAGEPIALATYGNIFTITRQAIINDDLGALSTVPQRMGRAAKRTIADLVYAILTNNANLKDGKPLFHADHKNLIGGALSVDSLSAARVAMRTQEDGSNNTLNITPKHLLVPAAMETLATSVIKSTSVEGASNSGVINPISGLLNIVTEPRLDKHDKAAFYLTANEQTIEVAYLDGVDVPYIETQQGFTIDGIATKVRIDAGVAPTDHRSMIKSTGK